MAFLDMNFILLIAIEAQKLPFHFSALLIASTVVALTILSERQRHWFRVDMVSVCGKGHAQGVSGR